MGAKVKEQIAQEKYARNQQQMNKLQQELAALLKDLKFFEKQRLGRESDVLKTKLNAKISEKHVLTDKINNLKSMNEELESHLSDSQPKNGKNNFKVEISKEIEKMRAEIEKIESKIQENESNAEAFSIDKQILEDHIEEQKATMEKLKNKLKNRKMVDCENESAKLELSENTMSELETDLQDKEKNLKKITEKLKEYSETVEDLEKEKKILEKSNVNENEEIDRIVQKLKKLEKKPKKDNFPSQTLQNIKYQIQNTEEDLKNISEKSQDFSPLNFERNEKELENFFKIRAKLTENVKKTKEYLDLFNKKISTCKEFVRNEILSAFNSAKTHFESIFQYFIPNKKCVMSLLNDDHPDVSDGVKLELFSSDCPEKKEKQQILSLSGGQKTLLALSFVFGLSIQGSKKHRQIPFYLFDEIDSALDVQKQEALRNSITKYFGKSQVIMVSHNHQVICGGANKDKIKDNVIFLEKRDGATRISDINK